MKRKKKVRKEFSEYRERVLKLERKAAQHENPYFRSHMRFYLYELRMMLSMWAHGNPEALHFLRETDTLIRNAEPMPWLETYRNTVLAVVRYSYNYSPYRNECSKKYKQSYSNLLCQAERFSAPEARETAKLAAYVCTLNYGWFEEKSDLRPSFDSLRKTLKVPALQRAAEKLYAQHFSTSEGDPFPNFKLADEKGDTLQLRDIKAEIILIDFWATWCGPCVEGMKKIEEMKEKYGDRLAVIGICSSDSYERMQNFVKKKNYPWHFVFDEENRYSDKLGVGSLPTYFILDGKHRLLLQPNVSANLKKEIAKLLKD